VSTAATVPAVYAGALLELAEERGKRESVVADIQGLLETLDANPALIAAVDGADLGRDQAKALLGSVFADKVEPEVLDFLRLLVDRARFGAVGSILAEVLKQAADAAGRVDVSITTAVELEPSAKASLEGRIRTVLGAGAAFTYAVEPELLGGLRLRYGDIQVDATVRRRLSDLRQTILDAPIAGVHIDGDPEPGAEQGDDA
jgi:F-type H+-transporting ATPase subunit delta